MINRVTGEVHFQNGLHILPHCSIQSLFANSEDPLKTRVQKLSLTGWKRHVLGFQVSDHGTFEVEALSTCDDRIHVVLLAHRHAFYEPRTPQDAERRAFHEGVVSSDLAGQKEFNWGEVLCRLESASNKDWLVIAYSREAQVPLPVREVILHLCAHEEIPEENS
jgi:hypothetical protein